MQLPIEDLRAERPAMHRGEHLDFPRVLDAEASDQPRMHQLLNRREHIFRRIALEKEKIAVRIVADFG